MSGARGEKANIASSRNSQTTMSCRCFRFDRPCSAGFPLCRVHSSGRLLPFVLLFFSPRSSAPVRSCHAVSVSGECTRAQRSTAARG